VIFKPGEPNTIYAEFWAARQAPWEVGASFQGPEAACSNQRPGKCRAKRLEKFRKDEDGEDE